MRILQYDGLGGARTEPVASCAAVVLGTKTQSALGALEAGPQQPFRRPEDELLRSRRGGRKGARAHPLPYPAPTEQVWEMEDNASGRHWRRAARRHAGVPAAEQREARSWDAGGVVTALVGRLVSWSVSSWLSAGPEQQLRTAEEHEGHRAQRHSTQEQISSALPGWQPVSRTCRYQGPSLNLVGRRGLEVPETHSAATRERSEAGCVVTTMLPAAGVADPQYQDLGGKGRRERGSLSEAAPAGGSSSSPSSPSSPSSGRGRPFQRTRRKKTKNAGRRWRQTRPADMERGRSMEGEMRGRVGWGHNHHPHECWPPSNVSKKTPDRKLARASAGPRPSVRTDGI